MQKKQETYLVTGASGFVGGVLVRHLLDEGKRVRGMVRSDAQAEGLRALGADAAVGDLSDVDSLVRAVDGIAGVYHIAALFRQTGFPDEVFHDVNAEGTRRLLDASINVGVRRFVHCSTVGVLGHIENPPADEDTPYHPGDVYQRTKMEGEMIALETFRAGAISGVVIRPAMIYGPGDARTLKLFRMIARRRFFYVGKGQAAVHWVDVRDLARAFRLAMEHDTIDGEVYIVAGKTSVTLEAMCREVADQLGVPPPWLRLPVRPVQWAGSLCEMICRPLGVEPPLYRRRVDFYTKSRDFNASKAQRDLGFEPAQDFSAEIGDIIRSYRESGRI